jgi:hypothetical protein
MAARVCDLEVVDIEGLAYFQFRWNGVGDEWWEALAALKSEVTPEAREFDEETKLWRVSCAYEDVLARIFPNFAATLDVMRSQLNLFGEARHDRE